MALEDPGSDSFDRGSIGDVARLGLAADLLRDRLKPLGAPGDQDTEVAARREHAGDRSADA